MSRVLLVVGAVLFVTVAAAGKASPRSDRELFDAGVSALGRGAPSEAIADFELLADRGFVHPDAAFDRAVAYIRRGESKSAEPGDLGRAAAALEEVLLLRPDDEAARGLLEEVREEIAQNRIERGAEPVQMNPSFGRAIIWAVREQVWAIGAAVGSLLVTLGLAARLWSRRPALNLSGNIAASVGMVILICFGAMAGLSRRMRLEETPAVVVVREARWLDEHGNPSTPDDATLPVVVEGAKVQVVEKRGSLAKIRWGAAAGWVALSQLRLLPDSRP